MQTTSRRTQRPALQPVLGMRQILKGGPEQDVFLSSSRSPWL